MSRTKKGSKGSGFDYWGRRGMKDKDTTKGTERTKTRLEVSEEMLKSRLPVRPKCPDCGLESLTGNVHEEDCPRMKEEDDLG